MPSRLAKSLSSRDARGFTVLEIVVVIYIISLAMVGVVSLMLQNEQAQYLNKNSLIASQLAQEGLEMTRNIRDSNWIINADWRAGGLSINQSYQIDSTGMTPATLDTARLNIDASGFYNHQLGGTPSIFSRTITISNSNSASTTAFCIVRWLEKGAIHDYRADTVFYDWR